MNAAALFFFVFLLKISLSALCPPGTWRQSALDPNKCYMVVTTRKIWFEAEMYCQNSAPNSHLISINSAFETFSLNAIVIDTQGISLCDQLWIGATDFDENRQFTWSDGNAVQYFNWQDGQPVFDGQSQCVLSQARTTGKWRTANCGTESCFICENYAAPASSTASTTALGTTTRPTSTSSTTLPTSTISSNCLSTASTGLVTDGPTTAACGDCPNCTDCLDWYNQCSTAPSGIYPINPPGMDQILVYCEMETDGGGWTVFQRRMDGSLSFYDKSWNEYKCGFNNGLNNSLWLGNDNIHVLSTKDANVELRIDIRGDRAPDASNPNVYLYGKWTLFSIDNEANYYTLHISSLSTGNASTSNFNPIYYNNGRKFSTIDVSHSPYNNCSGGFELGGWWVWDCSNVGLNGKYIPSRWHDGFGFFWFTGNPFYNPAQSRMMLRKLGM